MKKKKLLSYILSTSLLISLTSNPVLAMTGGANIDQEITSVQENQDNNSNQNDKNQESRSQDISDSKTRRMNHHRILRINRKKTLIAGTKNLIRTRVQMNLEKNRMLIIWIKIINRMIRNQSQIKTRIPQILTNQIRKMIKIR